MKSALTQSLPIVFVVDDDAAMRESLDSLIRSVGLRVEGFSSAREFLRKKAPESPAEVPVGPSLAWRQGSHGHPPRGRGIWYDRRRHS